VYKFFKNIIQLIFSQKNILFHQNRKNFLPEGRVNCSEGICIGENQNKVFRR